MTTEFFKGKQDRYPHPIRLFAIVMFLFLFLLNSMMKERESNQDWSLFSSKNEMTAETGDTLQKERSFSVYEQMKYSAMLYEMQQDFERLPKAWQTPEATQSVDSLMIAFEQRYGLDHKGLDSLFRYGFDTTGFGFNGIQIATIDLVRYDPEEIIERYQIKAWYDQLMVRQGIKSYKTPDALGHAYVGSLTWTILALIAIMSGFLALRNAIM